MKYEVLNKCSPSLSKDLVVEIERYGVVKAFARGAMIVEQGQRIFFLPIVLKGTVKIFCEEGLNQMLLYYIKPSEVCILSFAHLLSQTPVEFSAVAEENSELLLLPILKLEDWLSKFPVLNTILLKEYQKHYKHLLDAVKLLFNANLEERVMKYLLMKSSMTNSKTVRVSHQMIANDLATSREVISRLLKKMEKSKRISQNNRTIKLQFAHDA